MQDAIKHAVQQIQNKLHNTSGRLVESRTTNSRQIDAVVELGHLQVHLLMDRRLSPIDTCVHRSEDSPPLLPSVVDVLYNVLYEKLYDKSAQ